MILSQPTGTITLWPAKQLYHGSSVDVREEEETADKSEKSVGLVLVQTLKSSINPHARSPYHEQGGSWLRTKGPSEV